MVTDTNSFAFTILRFVRLHSELAGGHDHPGARPMHQVINSFRVGQVRAVGVTFSIYKRRLTLVPKVPLDGVITYSSKVWIPRSIGKLVNQRVGQY